MHWLRLDPSSKGYPWDVPALPPNGFPTPGQFLDLEERESFDPDLGFDTLVRWTLVTALAMAQMDPAIAESRTSQGRRLRQEMRATFFSRWNLGLYGCTNENYCGGVHPGKPGGEGRRAVVDHMMGPTGKGICWLPRHALNRELLAQGRAARRTIDMRGEPLLGAPGRARPLLWIAAVDLDLLATGDLSVVPLRWADGVEATEPPEVVRSIGIQDPIALPGMPSLVNEGAA